jgi:hypothetical protein
MHAWATGWVGEMDETKNPDEDISTASERETAYLLRSETMRRRLFEAMKRNNGIPFNEVCEKLGIDPTEEKDSDYSVRVEGRRRQSTLFVKLQEMNPA